MSDCGEVIHTWRVGRDTSGELLQQIQIAIRGQQGTGWQSLERSRLLETHLDAPVLSIGSSATRVGDAARRKQFLPDADCICSTRWTISRPNSNLDLLGRKPRLDTRAAIVWRLQWASIVFTVSERRGEIILLQLRLLSIDFMSKIQIIILIRLSRTCCS